MTALADRLRERIDLRSWNRLQGKRQPQSWLPVLLGGRFYNQLRVRLAIRLRPMLGNRLADRLADSA